jgi:hypothetical protein
MGAALIERALFTAGALRKAIGFIGIGINYFSMSGRQTAIVHRELLGTKRRG